MNWFKIIFAFTKLFYGLGFMFMSLSVPLSFIILIGIGCGIMGIVMFFLIMFDKEENKKEMGE